MKSRPLWKLFPPAWIISGMIPYPNINPDLFRIGPIHVRWYGLMYVLGFFASYLLIPRQERSRQIGLQGSRVDALMFYVFIGLIIGARLGYVLFYQYHDLGDFLSRPLEIIAVWHGGLSFHGGLIGCVVAGWLFCRKRKMPFWAVADSAVVTAPIGLGLGRVGNFINGELFGRPTNVPWAMIFPGGGPIPRHPSQLYEALMEGAVLFSLLWVLRKRAFADGMMIAFFLLLYGTFRFLLEFFREPDAHLGFILGPLTMGQLLSAAMILAGVVIALLLRSRQ
jgi:phosphatidylglycerol---prolipoprotein diacylglyceryl transferase